MPQLNKSPWKFSIHLLLLTLLSTIQQTSCLAGVLNDQLEKQNHHSYKVQRATIPKSGQIENLTDCKALRATDYLAEIQTDGFYCWAAAKLPVKVYFEPGTHVTGYKKRFIDCLSSCFDEWSSASNGKITWARVYSASESNIVVRWTNAVTERQEGTEAGRTKTFATLNTVTNRGTIHGAEIKLLTRLPEREFSPDELRRAYLHEVGHSLGIAGHSRNPDDIMYYAVTQHASPHLDERDRATINHLYGDVALHS